jgi:riboflavin kinase/FMN adenylyltransferase
MQVVAELKNVPVEYHGAVIALGNFDGLHKGHQVVLKAAREKARELKKPFGVMTFEPHPRSEFFPDHPPYRLTPPLIKRRLLAEMGVEVLFEIPFTREFSLLSAEAFIHDVLMDKCAIAYAVAGHDFVFGHKRTGTLAMLRERLAEKHIGVTEISPQQDAAHILWSSTRVREHLQKGEVNEAAAILGRPWAIEGIVQKGDGRGGQLGFPTANLDLDGYIRPRFGVYAVRVEIRGNYTFAFGKRRTQSYKAVANIGTRPTVDGTKEKLEAHLFDFAGDLYGQDICVNFIDFIRAEERFASLDALKSQIAKDCLAAHDILK